MLFVRLQINVTRGRQGSRRNIPLAFDCTPSRRLTFASQSIESSCLDPSADHTLSSFILSSHSSSWSSPPQLSKRRSALHRLTVSLVRLLGVCVCRYLLFCSARNSWKQNSVLFSCGSFWYTLCWDELELMKRWYFVVVAWFLRMASSRV
jgi:hypothetical protein